MLVYDISNYDSFKDCAYWLSSIREYADENVVIALVGKHINIIENYYLGNKTDVLHVNPNKRQVQREDAEKFARDNNLLFVGESSALSN